MNKNKMTKIYKKVFFVLIALWLIYVLSGQYNSQFIKANTKPDINKNDIASKEKLKTNFTERNLTLEELKCPDCNLVFISLTNTRKDHVGLYGYERNTTPNIDRFFQNSLVFENAFAPASWTLPVAVSLFSSLFPYSHGVMDRYDGSRFSGDVLTFAEILKANNYNTVAFTGGGDYNRMFNFNQGFDTYIDEGGSMGPGSYFGVENNMSNILEWLKKYSDKEKLFLFIQGFDTHCPFTPKEKFNLFNDGKYSELDFSTCLWTFERTEPFYEEGKKYWLVKTSSVDKDMKIKEVKMSEEDLLYMKALYDAEILQVDDQLKDFFSLVEQKQMLSNTIFIFMSEHGDLFGEHGRFMRGGPLTGTFYDPVINFPLVIKHPKINEPIKINSLIQTVDLMPTLLDILGIEDSQKEKREGKSLISELAGEQKINEYIFSASKYRAENNQYFDGLSQIEVIRDKEWKLIKEELMRGVNNPIKTYELFNIAKDSKEEHNLYESEKEIAKNLEKNLDLWFDKISD
jgi:arylsulfatase A-like enzyme